MHRRCFLSSLAAGSAAALTRVPFALPCQAGAQPGGGMFAADPFKPTEGANQPIGTGKGIHPGRVVWVRDANAASWDGVTGHWWDDAYTDQKAVHAMVSRLLRNLTGAKGDRQAWDALFASSGGYRPGERIAIKVNCNQDHSPQWGSGTGRRAQNGLPSPHVIAAVVTQLIERGGVRGEDILVYDVSRDVGQPIYEKVRRNASREFQAVQFLAGGGIEVPGRLSPAPDTANPIRFARNGLPAGYLPQQVTEAKHIINVALLRPHGLAGVTLTAKNHFGSIYFPDHGGWSPSVLHGSVTRTQPMGSYNALVDLTGHRHLGGKTLLYVLDGLYTAEHNEGSVFRWASLGDQWAASMLISQDPVAIDSVGLDLLRSEPRATEVRGHADNYLHEAAQAGKPPSGTIYRPDGASTLASLGVHEHWNNAAQKKYTVR